MGAANTLVGLSVIYAAKWFLGLGDVLANFVGYAVGIGLSFVLNKHWTFRHRGSNLSALVRFLVVTCVAYVSNLAVVLTCTRGYQVNSYVAQAVGIVPYIAVGYLGSRFFAFSPSRREA